MTAERWERQERDLEARHHFFKGRPHVQMLMVKKDEGSACCVDCKNLYGMCQCDEVPLY